ncbi:hypothetical protein ACP70R_021375 [Stipagrostis hirtigluma subsp. patula]
MAKRSSGGGGGTQQQLMVMGGSQPKKSKLSSTPSSLPDDAIGEVLLRLPSKSLARFRCVCRSWRRLISSPAFVRSHHALAAAAAPTRFTFAPVAPPHTWTLFPGYDVPCDECPRIAGPKPCHGLVLLGQRCTSTYSVCNPSTGGLLRLPPCLVGRDYFRSSAGIGFHEPTGEYKVVVLAARTYGVRATHCEVLTVGDPSARWRAPAGEESSSMPGTFDIQHTDPVLANGCLHWALGSLPFSKDHGVLSFSLAGESFRTVPLPPFAGDDVRRCYLDDSDPRRQNPRRPAYITCLTPVGPVLAELDGRLCMVRDLRHRDDIDSTFQIWRLDDSDAGAWSLVYLVDLAQHAARRLMTTWAVVPLCYLGGDDGDSSKDKDKRRIMVATTMHEVHVCDPKTRTLETVASMVDTANAPVSQAYPCYKRDHNTGFPTSEEFPGYPTSEEFPRIVMFQESLVHVAGMEYGTINIEHLHA